MTDSIDWLAQRVESDSFFLAPLLALYARSERLDDISFAAALGCDLQTLTRLRLCRPPRPDHFWDDVTSIAAHFHLAPEHLAEVVRRGQVIQQWQQGPSSSLRGPLLAARDQVEPPSDEPT